MKRNIAIVAGGDSSEIVISLKSAEGIFSFLDKDKYNVYIAIVKRDEWAVKLPGGAEVGRISALKCWISVDFPLPVCPIIPINCPSGIERLISFSAWIS